MINFRIAGATFAIFVALSQGAQAQSSGYALSVPEATTLDRNSVDVVSGRPQFNVATTGIGSKSASLNHQLFFGSPTNDPFSGGFGGSPQPLASDSNPQFLVTLGNFSERFRYVSGGYQSFIGKGSKLVDGGVSYLYTRYDGVQIVINKVINPGTGAYYPHYGYISSIQQPDGKRIDISMKAANVTISGRTTPYFRIQSVRTNIGYQLKYDYETNVLPSDSTSIRTWQRLKKVTAFNSSYQYCDPDADTCTLDESWPASTIDYTFDPTWPGLGGTVSVTDSRGATTRVTKSPQGEIIGYKPPNASVDQFSYTYCSYTPPYNCTYFTEQELTIVSGIIVGAQMETQSWTYDFYSSPNIGNYYSSSSSTGPTGTVTVLKRMPWLKGPLLALTTDDGQGFSYEQSDRNLMTAHTIPDGPRTSFEYDARGNLIKATMSPKAGSSIPAIEKSAGFDTTCVSLAKCNKPNWVKDGKGNQADFTYDSTHGGITSETLPAGITGIRPQRKTTYVQRRAWVIGASGTYQQTEPIWLPDTIVECRTTSGTASGCSGTNDEVTTSFFYGADTGPNNLLLRGKSVSADGVTLLTCYGYDKLGNVVSETSPRASLAVCP